MLDGLFANEWLCRANKAGRARSLRRPRGTARQRRGGQYGYAPDGQHGEGQDWSNDHQPEQGFYYYQPGLSCFSQLVQQLYCKFPCQAVLVYLSLVYLITHTLFPSSRKTLLLQSNLRRAKLSRRHVFPRTSCWISSSIASVSISTGP